MSSLEKNTVRNVRVKSNVKEQPPVKGRAYKGLSTVNPDNKSYALYDIGLIKQDLLNHFHIRQGEKLENPEFGTIIWDVLFEPLTDSLKEAIITNVTDIINSDPRINATGIVVDQYESGIQIECKLQYLPYNISEQMKFSFDKDAGFAS
jgi:phage baseplate assembly protein W|tara:strand:- start:1096 stop:1542 length:447 start_codon:yes stop_codon:yes gene_type:complete